MSIWFFLVFFGFFNTKIQINQSLTESAQLVKIAEFSATFSAKPMRKTRAGEGWGTSD